MPNPRSARSSSRRLPRPAGAAVRRPSAEPTVGLCDGLPRTKPRWTGSGGEPTDGIRKPAAPHIGTNAGFHSEFCTFRFGCDWLMSKHPREVRTLANSRSRRNGPRATLAAAAIAIAVPSVGVAIASAEPAPERPPNCTAADLAGVATGVAAATSAYLFTHPDVNDFFTRLHGLPDDAIPGELRTYMDSKPQVHNDLLGIRQPLTDLRARCQ